MPTKRDGKTYYYLNEAAQVFGIRADTLITWLAMGELKSRRGNRFDIFLLIEEQSLRACIVRHKGDKR